MPFVSFLACYTISPPSATKQNPIILEVYVLVICLFSPPLGGSKEVMSTLFDFKNSFIICPSVGSMASLVYPLFRYSFTFADQQTDLWGQLVTSLRSLSCSVKCDFFRDVRKVVHAGRGEGWGVELQLPVISQLCDLKTIFIQNFFGELPNI